MAFARKGAKTQEGFLVYGDVPYRRMPNVSDRGLRHALYRVAKGSRLAAASYLADRCAAGGASSPALRALEADAEAWEQKELLRAAEDSRKAEEAARKVEEGRRRDKAERDALKGCIVGRYADEVRARVALFMGWTSGDWFSRQS